MDSKQSGRLKVNPMIASFFRECQFQVMMVLTPFRFWKGGLLWKLLSEHSPVRKARGC
jgi:hypothetical protein